MVPPEAHFKEVAPTPDLLDELTASGWTVMIYPAARIQLPIPPLSTSDVTSNHDRWPAYLISDDAEVVLRGELDEIEQEFCP